MPGLTKDQFNAAEQRIRRAVRDLVGTGASIRLVSSTLIPAEEIVLSIFEATEKKTVIEANWRSGVHFDRVQAAVISREADPE